MNVNITWFEKNITNSTQSKIDPVKILNLFVKNSSSLITAYTTPRGLVATINSSRIIISGKQIY